MDEMKLKLSTRFMRGIVSKLIARTIFKQFGFKAEIHLNEIELDTVNDKIHLHINADGKIDQKDLLKIIRLTGLEEDE